MKPKITDSDLCRNAKRINTGVAEIKTFLAVETKNKGFDTQDRPIILFERHWFHKFTEGKYDGSHPNISNKVAGGYGSSASQYDRFSIAFALDPNAAMKSTSWGLGQVMGFNYPAAGYSSVGKFVDAMKESEGKQLDAAINFILHNGLDDELRRHDWKGFARGYNGANYKINDYDTKLTTFYKKFKASLHIDCAEVTDEPEEIIHVTEPESVLESTDTKAPVNALPTQEVNVTGDNAKVIVPPQTPPASSEPITIKSVTTSMWSKLLAALTAITGMGINLNDAIQAKLEAITIKQIIFAFSGTALMIVAVWYYKSRQEAADKKTHSLIDNAADQKKNTVNLES